MKRRWVIALVAVLITGIILVWISFPFILTFMVDQSRVRRMQDLRVAYYNGDGAWYADDIVIPNLTAWMGCQFSTIRGSDIQAGDLMNFDVLIWPGGHYPAYWEEVGQVGKTKIQEFVTNGGGYLGICAGAYWACDYMVWMDDDAFPPPDYKVEGDEENLDLFPGVAWGPIFEIADRPEPGYAMTQINITDPTHPITDSLPSAYQMLYAGGPYIQPYDQTEYSVLGIYNVTSDPAIVSCEYGAGRVFLIAPHGEIEEQSDRDGWEFPPEYLPEPYDPESEWPLYFEAMRWLGKVNPLEPVPSFVHYQPHQITLSTLFQSLIVKRGNK